MRTFVIFVRRRFTVNKTARSGAMTRDRSAFRPVPRTMCDHRDHHLRVYARYGSQRLTTRLFKVFHSARFAVVKRKVKRGCDERSSVSCRIVREKLRSFGIEGANTLFSLFLPHSCYRYPLCSFQVWFVYTSTKLGLSFLTRYKRLSTCRYLLRFLLSFFLSFSISCLLPEIS